MRVGVVALVGLAWLALLAPPVVARAQDRASAAALADVRLAHRATDRGAGIVLLGWGASSVLAGGAMAIAGGAGDSTFWLTMGLTNIAWGLANGLLALTFFDLSGSRRADIERARRLTGGAFLEARDEAIGDSYASAIMFAVNAGLDVAYVATGILLFALGRAQSDADVRDGLSAFGLASAIQGGLLLPFDVAGWARNVARAHERRSVSASR